MKIKSIKLTNFKGVEAQEAIFQNHNKITGFNGAGKSAIKEAIIFGLYGRTPDGSSQNVDTFIKKDMGSTRVAIMLDNDTEVSRMKSERSTMAFFNDGSQDEEDSRVAQRDLEGHSIPLFENFINVFNAGYFMNVLDDKAQRLFTMSLTPPIDRLELFKSAGGDMELCQKFGIDPEDFAGAFKKAKEERFEWKSDVEKLRAQKEYVESQIPQDKAFTDMAVLEKELDDAQKERDGMIDSRDKWIEYRAKEDGRAPAIMHNSKVSRQAEEILRGVKPVPEEPSALYLEKLNQEIIKLYSLNLPSDHECPTCHQPISDEHRAGIDTYNKATNEKRQALEAEYEKERTKYDAAEKERNQIIRDNMTAEARAKTLRGSTVDMPEVYKPAVIDPSEKDINTKQVEVTYLRAAIDYRKEEIRLKENIKNGKETLDKIEILCNLFGPTGLPSVEAEKKVKPIEDELLKFVEGVKIITLRLLKNGMEFKDTFDIEVNGKRYARLSSGEKKKVDVALSIVFNKFLKKQLESPDMVPDAIFIDDADLVDAKGIESILSHVEDQQIFITHVTNNQLKLETYERGNNASKKGGDIAGSPIKS